MCIRDRPYAVPICSFRSAPASSTTNSPTTSTAGTPTSPEHRTPRLRRSPRDPLTCGWGLPHLDTPRGTDTVFAARLPRKVAVSLGVPAVVVICRSGGTGFASGVTWHRCRGVLGMLWWTTASSSLTAVTARHVPGGGLRGGAFGRATDRSGQCHDTFVGGHPQRGCDIRRPPQRRPDFRLQFDVAGGSARHHFRHPPSAPVDAHPGRLRRPSPGEV